MFSSVGDRPAAVVISGGALADPASVKNYAAKGNMLVCADGGALYALNQGLVPTAVIGDFDTLPMETVDDLRGRGCEVVEYPSAKDYTDTDLAIQWAIENGAGDILLVAALGGRPDHALANLALAERVTREGHCVHLLDGENELAFTTHRLDVTGHRGEVVSLMAWGGPAEGIVTRGLLYPLKGETLNTGETRGISNRLLREQAVVEVKKGCLLVAHRLGEE